MLSYRHSYHAGNFADVLKHITQIKILEHLLQKPKAFVYVDTHAGAGRYDLHSPSSQKTAEFKQGIAQLWKRNDLPKEIQSYMHLIQQIQQTQELTHYPGSPLIAQQIMPRNYRLELAELHSSEIKFLQQEFINCRNVNIHHKDGYLALKSVLPPIQRRGLILIDPSYELKNEYHDVVKNLKSASKQFPTGIYAVWYPMISRKVILDFCKRFKNSGIKNILRIEMTVQADHEGYGMTGTGMIIVNPPWKLAKQMRNLLPWLCATLKQNEQAQFLVEQLVTPKSRYRKSQ